MTRKFFSTIAVLGLFAAAKSVAAQSPKAVVGALPVPARRAYYQVAFMHQAVVMYAKMGLGATGLSLPVFREGLVGYYNLRSSGKYAAAPPVLTLIDFSQSSQQKRLWVINIEKCKVLFHTLVAHG